MDKYRRVPKVKDTEEKPDNEIRVTAVGSVSAYVSFAAKVFNEMEKDELVVKATGNALTKAVTLTEVIKRRFKALHQVTKIGTQEIIDEYEPLEEGLDKVTDKRNVAYLEITLSKKELDTKAPGYQAPLDESLVTEMDAEEMTRSRGRGRGRGKGKGKGKGKGSSKGKSKGWSKGDSGGKGKGKGKSKDGKGKGKDSKGKGKDKGKGKGKGSSKGKSKGYDSYDRYDSYGSGKGKGKGSKGKSKGYSSWGGGGDAWGGGGGGGRRDDWYGGGGSGGYGGGGYGGGGGGGGYSRYGGSGW